MPKRGDPPASRKLNSDFTCPGGGSKALETEHGSSRPSSPFAALAPRRTRFSSVPLVEIRHPELEDIALPASVELPRRHVTFFTDSDTESSFSAGGLCSMSDTVESFKDGGGSPCQPSVRIKHLTRNSDGSSRFPKLDECAHFHYDNVELGPISVSLCEDRQDPMKSGVDVSGGGGSGDLWFCIQVTSNGRSWEVRRNLDNFQMLDRQLHRCVYDRKFSLLKEIVPAEHRQNAEDVVRIMLTEYLERFSQLAGSLINCGPVLNWLELDNRGNRLIITDEAAINTPAVAAAYVIKRYASQATDEISFEVGDIISVIDMPPPDESTWWRGKKGFQVGFFPCECVEIIGDKVPQTIKIPKVSTKPVLRKHGKLIAFFRQFLLSRPSRRKLKQSGILKERVFGCDLGEHLMNTGRDIPMVLKCCTEFIEEYGIVDGIYRLSGVTSNIQKLRLAFDEDRVPNLLDEAILQDIHCVASLLKMYFRELPNPLLTFHLYDKFVNAVQAEEDIRLLKLRDVVQQLPPPHYRSLEYLMRHLSKVASYGSQTGMTPKNVAIVWAPNLLRSRDVEGGGVGALHVVGVQAILTEYLIRYTDIIFSEKMPVFPSPGHGEETPKKTRPKSLAISTPTKLLSLEEARSRALTSNLPTEQQKFIEVGGGVENLPTKYHTVIELPPGRRGLAKGKKSPSGWKSFFSRGWHTSSGRTKSRGAQRNDISMQSPKVLSPLLHSPLALQDKAITESDVSHTNHKKLRTVKSAESLLSTAVTGLTPQRLDAIDSLSPQDESTISSQQTSFDYTPLQEAISSSSPMKSPSYQKHFRSTSHDSYFEHAVEYSHVSETEMDFSDSLACKDDKETVDQNGDIHLQGESICIIVGDETFKKTCTRPMSIAACEGSPTKLKVAQKQKLVTFDSEASSPKVQKLSKKSQAVSSSVSSDKSEIKISSTISDEDADTAGVSKERFGAEMFIEASSDSGQILKSNTLPQMQKQQVKDMSSETQTVASTPVTSQLAVLSETSQIISVCDINLQHSTNLPLKSEVSAQVPFSEEVPQAKIAPLDETEQPVRHLPSLVGKTVFAEVHSSTDCSKIVADASIPDSFKNITSDNSIENGDSETALHSNARDSRDALLSLSMEATLSDTLSISQLLSFDSKECGLFSPGPEPNGKVSSDMFGSAPQDSSLLTPDSPTMDNVSDMPSSAGSEMSCSPGDGEKGDKPIFVPASIDKIALSFIDSNEQALDTIALQQDKYGQSVSKPQDSSPTGVNEIEESSSSDTISKAKNADMKRSFVDDAKNANYHQADEILAQKTSSLQITSTHIENVTAENGKVSGDAIAAGSIVDSHFHSEEPLFSESLFTDGNIILSPPANFVDDHEVKRAEEQGKNNVNKSMSSSKTDSSSPSHVTLERSRTEVHEICPKFVSGISFSGTFGHQISSLSQELLDSPLCSKKRSGSDRMSPISPVEESRRKFESEIGRLIVRDRQMRLEMEQMQAERQKHKARTESTPSDKNVAGSKAEKKFADIIEMRRSPGKVAETFISTVEKRTSETDDHLKCLKDSAGQKRSSEISASSHIYPRFMRMDNKPSVKELLSKFEAQPSDSSPVSSSKKASDSPDSCAKQKHGLFSNVQVINHEMHSPLAQESAESCYAADSTATHFKEHIFQTECVVRFPHPKTSTAQQKGLSKTRSGSSDKSLESQRKSSADLDTGIKSREPAKKLTTSRAVFLSSDNLLNNYVNYNFSKQNSITSQPGSLSDYSPRYISRECSVDSLDSPFRQHGKLDRHGDERHGSCKLKTFSTFLNDIKSTPLPESEENKKIPYDERSTTSPAEKHTCPKDIRRDKKKPSVKLKDEFFAKDAKDTSKQLSSDTLESVDKNLKDQNKVQRELSFTKKGSSQGCVQKSALRSERRLKRSPVKERPKSVPPPVCRLSLTAPKHPKAVHVVLPRTGTEQVSLDINKNSDHVPMNITMHCGSNRENQPEETTASQRHSPPRNVRDRAAMFERSLSFSGCTESLSVQPMTQSLTMFGTQTGSFAAQK